MGQRGDEERLRTLKRGLVNRESLATRGGLTRALVDDIDVWYNPEHRHSHLGYVSPVAYEAQLTRVA